MKSPCLLIIFSAACLGSLAQTQTEGERNFQAFCAACHSIGKGKLVGPDLIDVHTRRTDDWLVEFISSSQTMIGMGMKPLSRSSKNTINP
jgi:cytochrome c2